MGKTSDGFLKSPPLAKEIEDFASNRLGGDGYSPGEIMKETADRAASRRISY